ncbi:phosphatidate cytidylyltransferase [Acidipila rosea]|uniref:Phosphatidate cytidylyltransferase n=1 Tax=Acidipila rosea TaxID=768535 RepID=A0A4R1L738_9BACT|nr:CDP-archaeol synthase [Acidipila rosea]MBW4043722.1 CDP-archaeol synthase [Acidobacteriota bacterium]TCK74022.1 phosphatidate cytidylyltransferase [Acidipila rosea]
MKRVLTALVLIPLVLLLVFRGPFWLVTLVAAVVAELATWEYLDLADKSGAKTPRIAVLIGIGLLFLCAFFRPEYMAPLLACLTFLILIFCSFRSPLQRVLPDTAYSVFALVYLGLSLTTLPLLSAQENGASLLLLLFATVWTGDIAALYVGRSVGRHKLAPTISPKKTWEGSLGSIAGSILITLLLLRLADALAAHGVYILSYPGTLLRWLLLAVVLNVAAQLGDLVESAIKRGAGVKDSGSLLPGHGGMLDRIDALLLAAPLLWYAQLAQQAF